MTDRKPLTRYIAPAIITAFMLIAAIIGLSPRGPKADFVESAVFQQAMDRSPSGQENPIQPQIVVAPVQTFFDRNGNYCRVFTLMREIEGNGIVCREDGTWVEKAQAAPEDSNRILISGVADLGGSRPFDMQTEQQVIASGWDRALIERMQ